MCGIYYCITCMCKSHLHLVSFLFVPALYYTFIYLSPHFVLSDVIYSRGYCRFVHMYMYIQKGNGVLFNFFCCGMYEEYCLPTNCDNVVSCIKTTV